MSILSASDAEAANTGQLDRLSPRRLPHYLRQSGPPTVDRLWLIAQDVNRGVFGGRGEAHTADALGLIPRVNADVVYLDPPYPRTTAYGGAYAPLDAILGQNELSAESPALPDLLAACEHISCLVLSYGGPTASLGQLSNIVGRYRQVATALAVPYTHLKSIASEEKRATDREYLIVAKT